MEMLILIVILLVPLFLILLSDESPSDKGRAGESEVSRSLSMHLDSEKYHVINNVTLPTKDGSTQIDHVIVSEFGVFVVETKNMSGWIFGNPAQKNWTQVLHKHRTKFQNPLHQNYKHVKTLQSLLGLNKDQLESVIVFVGESEFKTEMPDNVTNISGCARYIETKSTSVLTGLQVIEIVEKIERGRLEQSLETDLKHVEHVKQITSEKERRDDAFLCPKCGSEMVLRESKKGASAGNKFWGCQTFPKCRGVRRAA